MRESLRGFWRSISKSRYVRNLEDQNAFLQAELHKWQNAMLESKGLPGIIPREKTPMPVTKGRLTPSQWRTKAENLTSPKESNVKN